METRTRTSKAKLSPNTAGQEEKMRSIYLELDGLDDVTARQNLARPMCL